MVDWDDIKKPLIGAAVSLAVISGAYLYIISGGTGGKGRYPEQNLIIEQLNKAHKGEGDYITFLEKDFKTANQAQEMINSAQVYLNQEDLEKCLDQIINAKGLMSKIKGKDSKELKKYLNAYDKSLMDVRKGLYQKAKEKGYMLK